MQLTVKSLKDKKELNDFLDENKKYTSFMHTWDWGEFHKSLGKKIYRLAIYNGNKIVASLLLIEEITYFGKYLYIPRGPLCNYSDVHLLGSVVKTITECVSQRVSSLFIRMDPALLEDEGYSVLFKNLGFKDSVYLRQVARAWIVDIGDKDDDALLEWLKQNGMRKNLPYYIRTAPRKGVIVRSSTNMDDLEILLDLMKALFTRKNAVMMPREYYVNLCKILFKSDMARIFIAEYDGKPLAAAMIITFGNEASYLHGASSEEHRELSAPAYMQMEIMKYYRDRGINRYNFWGIVKEKNMHPKNPGYGYSLFKKSFGGRLETYIQPKDYAYKPLKYKLYRLIEHYRKIRYKME